MSSLGSAFKITIALDMTGTGMTGDHDLFIKTFYVYPTTT